MVPAEIERAGHIKEEDLVDSLKDDERSLVVRRLTNG